jgi:hypothetical protein
MHLATILTRGGFLGKERRAEGIKDGTNRSRHDPDA